MLAGNEGRTLMAECPGALLQFFDTPGACVLRLVRREFQAAVAAYPWEDMKTVILGSIGGWRTCFPRARCANVRMNGLANAVVRHTPVVDADFVHFVGLWELNMSGCAEVTDAAFAHLQGIRVLDMSCCDQPTITDAGLANLVGIQKLNIEGCIQATLTDAAFAPLGGICVLNMLPAVHGRNICAPHGHSHPAHGGLQPAHHHGRCTRAPQGHQMPRAVLLQNPLHGCGLGSPAGHYPPAHAGRQCSLHSCCA